MLGYWVCGFALHMGGVGAVAVLGGTPPLNSEFTINLFGKTLGLFGMKGFFLSGNTYDVGVFALFLFQMVFMDTAATIPTGAMAERWKFSSFCIFALLHGRASSIRSTATGSGAAAGWPAGRRTSAWATDTWILPAPRWCT